jgi:aspartyl-tRNA(Asn)/glutamyl-tRNA(Gln) amidotransferase subunit A
VRIRPGDTITATSYIDLIKPREQFIRTINAAAAGYDAMLMSTTPETAPTIAEAGKDDETYIRLNLRVLRNPTIVNQFDGCTPILEAGCAAAVLVLVRAIDKTMLHVT